MEKRKAICNYCGKEDELHNYMGFTMCDECIQRMRGVIIKVGGERK